LGAERESMCGGRGGKVRQKKKKQKQGKGLTPRGARKDGRIFSRTNEKTS